MTNKLLLPKLVIFLLLLASCDDRKTTYHLTDQQKSMLTLIHPGDIVLLESNTGVRDTAIVQEFIYDEAELRSPGSFDKGTWGERITVNYKIIGKNKLGPIPSIRVTADGEDNLITNTFTCGGYRCDSATVHKQIGTKNYPLVFWRLNGNPNDTIFWNQLGYLGYIKPDTSINRIR